MVTAPIQQLELTSVEQLPFPDLALPVFDFFGSKKKERPYGITKKDLSRLMEQSRPYGPVDYFGLEAVCQGLVSAYNGCPHNLDTLLSRLQPSEILAFGWVIDFINIMKKNRKEYDDYGHSGWNQSGRNDFLTESHIELQRLFSFAWTKIYRSGKTSLQARFLMIQGEDNRLSDISSVISHLEPGAAESVSYFINSGEYTDGTLMREGGTRRSIKPFVDDAHMFISQIRDGTIHPLKLHEKNPVYR